MNYIILETFNIINNLNVVYTIFCFLITLKREIIKDMEDIEGDRKIGSYTLPVFIGLRITKFFTAIIILIEIIFLILCFIQTPSNMKLYIIFFNSISVLLLFCYQLYFSKNQQKFK